MKKIILTLLILILSSNYIYADNLVDNSVVNKSYDNFIKDTDKFCNNINGKIEDIFKSFDDVKTAKEIKDKGLKKFANDYIKEETVNYLEDELIDILNKKYCNNDFSGICKKSLNDIKEGLNSATGDKYSQFKFIMTKSIPIGCDFTKIGGGIGRIFLRETDNVDNIINNLDNQYQNLLKIENNKLNLIESEYVCGIKTKQGFIKNYTDVYNNKCVTLKNQYTNDLKQLESFEKYNSVNGYINSLFGTNKTQKNNENIDDNSNFFCMGNLDERLTYLDNKKKEIGCSYNTLNYLDKNGTTKDKNWAKTFRKYFNLIDKLPESKKKILANNVKENDDSLINILYKYTKLTYFKDSNISKNYPGCDSNDIVLGNGQTWSACNVGTNNSGKVGSYFQFGSNKSGYVEGHTSTGIAWGGNSEDNLFSNGNNDNLLRQGVCAKGWHIPSVKEWMDLCSYFKGSQCNYNQVSSTSEETKGYTDKEFVLQQKLVNTLKLPLGGIYEGKLDYDGSYGFYWSSSPYNNSTYLSYMFQFTNNVVDVTFQNRVRGYNVRCIKN